jgi:hypothetical protein
LRRLEYTIVRPAWLQEVVRGTNATGKSVDIAHAYAPFLPSAKPRTATLVVSREGVPDLTLPLTAAQVDLIQ